MTDLIVIAILLGVFGTFLVGYFMGSQHTAREIERERETAAEIAVPLDDLLGPDRR